MMGFIDEIVEEKFKALEKEVEAAKTAKLDDLLWEKIIEGFKGYKTEHGKYPDECTIFDDEEELFLVNSQFVNASEYAEPADSKENEIGRYVGVRIIVQKRLK